MSSITPRSTQLRHQTDAYVSDAKSIVDASLAIAQSSRAFAEVFHISLSSDAVLSGLSSTRLQPRLAGARSIVLRIPLLVGIGQQSVAMVELRRFLELVCWTIYFTDHPVEWRIFRAESGTGFSRDTRQPIAYAAHRELAHYIDYARELMNFETSGLAVQAIEKLKQASHELNAAVHAGQTAQTTVRKPPHEQLSEAALRKFSGIQRQVFSNSCLVLGAYGRSKFDQLSAAARAHFDWLVGSKLRKQVRQGPFGIPITRS